MLLHYTDSGEGPPVVLIHGMAASGRYWLTLQSYLKKKRVISLDLLGYGRSPMPKNIVYNYDSHIKSIIETLDSINVNQPFTLVGHSMGALLALRLAVTYPTRVSKLIIVSMPVYKNAATARQMITSSKLLTRLAYYGPTSYALCTVWCKFMRPISRRVAPLYLRYLPKIVAEDSVYHTWQSYSQTMSNVIEDQHVLQDIAALTMTTKLVYGHSDLPAMLKGIDISSVSKNAKLVILQGSHQIVNEQPAELAELI